MRLQNIQKFELIMKPIVLHHHVDSVRLLTL